MKKISFLLLGFIMSMHFAAAQNGEVDFNEKVHDFGTIAENGGSVSCEFTLTNNTASPLVISKVKASCGCTTPDWTKEPIEPGKAGTIKVTYNPLRRPGLFSKTVTVYTSQSSSPYILKIKGEVLKENDYKEYKVSQDPTSAYPVSFGKFLMKTKEVHFDQLNTNTSKTMNVEIYNNSDAGQITPKAEKLPKYIKVAFSPQTIPAKGKGVMELTFDGAAAKEYGIVNGEVEILVEKGVKGSVLYTARVIDDFEKWTATEKANAGKIYVNVARLDFNNVANENSKVIKISNSGKNPLSIKNIQSSSPLVTVSKTHFTIKPGEIADLKVNIEDKKIQSSLTTTLTIVSDDPSAPVKEIKVIAKS